MCTYNNNKIVMLSCTLAECSGLRPVNYTKTALEKTALRSVDLCPKRCGRVSNGDFISDKNSLKARVLIVA